MDYCCKSTSGRIAHRFWEYKSLGEMNDAEWGALCDGCARCCLVKFEDIETKATIDTTVACKLLNLETCRCTHYEKRHELVADCIRIHAENIDKLSWLPDSCAYRKIARSEPLEWWHPLISNRLDTVIESGISIFGKAVSERDVHPDDIEEHLLRWV